MEPMWKLSLFIMEKDILIVEGKNDEIEELFVEKIFAKRQNNQTDKQC